MLLSKTLFLYNPHFKWKGLDTVYSKTQSKLHLTKYKSYILLDEHQLHTL